MHAALLLILLYRASLVWSFYLDLLCIALGIPTAPLTSTSGLSDTEMRSLVLRRAGTLLLDFILFRYAGAWTWLFFVGDGLNAPDPGPARWRLALGFRPREVTVRASRATRWAAEEFWSAVTTLPPRNALSMDPAAQVLRERVAPAIDPAWMAPRTGYMMMGRDWELDFAAMLHAHDLLKPAPKKRAVDGDAAGGSQGGDDAAAPRLAERDFELSLLVYKKDVPGWLFWRLIEDEDLSANADADIIAESLSATDSASTGNGRTKPKSTSTNPLGVRIGGQSEAQARARIEAVHARLTALQRDELFYRLVEIVQYESNQAGGLTAERKGRVKAKAREAFTAAGIDFDKFVEDIGGEEMLPGFD